MSARLVLLGVCAALLVEAADAVMARQGIQSASTGAASRKDALATEITYPQVYATPDGETHFREISVPLTAEASAPRPRHQPNQRFKSPLRFGMQSFRPVGALRIAIEESSTQRPARVSSRFAVASCG
jgi:hypothetical protein